MFSVLEDHTHPPAEPFDDAVVRDRLAEHGASPCYAGERGKSIRANELDGMLSC